MKKVILISLYCCLLSLTSLAQTVKRQEFNVLKTRVDSLTTADQTLLNKSQVLLDSTSKMVSVAEDNFQTELETLQKEKDRLTVWLYAFGVVLGILGLITTILSISSFITTPRKIKSASAQVNEFEEYLQKSFKEQRKEIKDEFNSQVASQDKKLTQLQEHYQKEIESQKEAHSLEIDRINRLHKHKIEDFTITVERHYKQEFEKKLAAHHEEVDQIILPVRLEKEVKDNMKIIIVSENTTHSESLFKNFLESAGFHIEFKELKDRFEHFESIVNNNPGNIIFFHDPKWADRSFYFGSYIDPKKKDEATQEEIDKNNRLNNWLRKTPNDKLAGVCLFYFSSDNGHFPSYALNDTSSYYGYTNSMATLYHNLIGLMLYFETETKNA